MEARASGDRPTRVHETGRRMDQEAETAEARLALEATDEVVGRRTRSTVEPRTNSPGCSIRTSSSEDHDQFGELLLILLDVDRTQVVVAEDAEVAVDVRSTDEGWMQPSLERVDDDPAVGELFTDRLVKQDHRPEQVSRP